MSTAPVVRVEGLHKSFGDLEVLRGVDLEVHDGEVIVIFGRSGSGKSTLLRCVNFLEDPTEGFVEIAVPLLNAQNATLDVNGAARYSDYSTSGGIWSWKAGATLRLFDDLLLRTVYSRDIRSPSIAELFTGRATNIAPVNDPYNNNAQIPSVISYTGGNPNLNPETSNTLTLGGSYSPRFADRKSVV